jgi:hypothetical protein
MMEWPMAVVSTAEGKSGVAGTIQTMIVRRMRVKRTR